MEPEESFDSGVSENTLSLMQNALPDGANATMKNASQLIVLESCKPENIERIDKKILGHFEEIIDALMDIVNDKEVSEFARIAAAKAVIDNGSKFVKDRMNMARDRDTSGGNTVNVIIDGVGFNPTSSVGISNPEGKIEIPIISEEEDEY